MRFLLVCIFIATALATNYPGNVTFDDLSLKLCNKDKQQRYWTLHGWWPEYSKHKYPSWCNKTEYHDFNLTVLKPLLPYMNAYWYSCPEWKGTSNKELWLHEWEKHGTCIPTDTVFEYFYHTLLAFGKAKKNNWYGCCVNQTKECLIPHSKLTNETQWLRWCY